MTAASPIVHDRRRPATLWLIATPIGNLGDLPPRAVEILAAAELVACEDTRRTSKLLRHAGIRTKQLIVANEHTEFAAADVVVGTLADGGDVALVSDAGTPGVSDPGALLVRRALEAGFEVSAVPGPVAAVMALTISGLPTERFVFEGFLPRKGSDRKTRLAAIAIEPRTTVLYEAPHRIARTIADLISVCGPKRRVAVSRELTKVYETTLRGTLGSIEIGEPRGEYVIVLEGIAPRPYVDDADIVAEIIAAKASGMSTKQAVTAVARQLSVPKNRVYALAHEPIANPEQSTPTA